MIFSPSGASAGVGFAVPVDTVNRVVPDAEILSHAVSVAEKLAAMARPAMRETKRLFHEVADLALAPALERGRDTNKRMRNFAKLGGKT